MIYCSSELGRLRSLMVHMPDPGINRISPSQAERLLFDDIVHYPQLLEEYQQYIDVLQICLGKENVRFVEDLLAESLKGNSDEKEELLDLIIIEEELHPDTLNKFNEMEPDHLAKVLISGYDPIADRIYFDPIPNFMFTRDIAVTVNHGVIVTKANKMARWRENLLTRMIIAKHDIYGQARSESKVVNLNRPELFPPGKYGEKVSVEGGDVMIINEHHLLVGVSERSTEHGFNLLKESLFNKNIIDNVVKINIPKDRSCMHIDTIFTMIDKKEVVCYKPVVYDGIGSNVEVHRKSGETTIYNSVKDYFHNEIDSEINFIFAGKGISPYQEREQWTDGCNLLALRPGVGIAYDRNMYTAQAFEKVGYKVVTAADFIAEHEGKSDILDQIEKTIITLPSGELSRARGGSHCMSMPILRDHLKVGGDVS